MIRASFGDHFQLDVNGKAFAFYIQRPFLFVQTSGELALGTAGGSLTSGATVEKEGHLRPLKWASWLCWEL